MADTLIEFDKVVAGYSPSVTILNELTLDARKAEITLLIGPNGAGKSTVLRTLFGMLIPRSGEVRFEGKRINGKTQRQLLAEGIAFVPQGRNLFGSLSVRHNLELGGITLPSTMQITCGQSLMMKSMLCSITTKLPPCVLLSSTRSSCS